MMPRWLSRQDKLGSPRHQRGLPGANRGPSSDAWDAWSESEWQSKRGKPSKLLPAEESDPWLGYWAKASWNTPEWHWIRGWQEGPYYGNFVEYLAAARLAKLWAAQSAGPKRR